MLVKTPALVLKSIRYRDADLIAKCYTRESGLKSYLLRGILKSKKAKIRSSHFQPLNHLEIVASHKNKGSLEYIREVHILNLAGGLQSNVFKSSIAMFLSEILRNAIQEEETNAALFDFLTESFRHLNDTEKHANFHLLFLLKLSQYLGFYPDRSNFGEAYFDLMEGNFQGSESNKHCASGQNTDLLNRLLGISYAEAEHITLNKNMRNDFLEMLMLYYQIHLQGFYRPKSLDILKQLFS